MSITYQEAIAYSHNFATAKPDIGATEKEHILGLCEVLEAVGRERDKLATTQDKICNAFGIGEAARTSSILLTNVENASRFAVYLHAIETEFFMAPREPDNDSPDETPQSECLVNSFGAKSREHYVEQFREALARRDAEVRGKALREVAAHIYNGEFSPSNLAKWCLDQDREGRRQAEGGES